MTNLKDFESWEKQGLSIFKKGAERVYMVVEYSNVFGDLVTSFQIGDKAHGTGVKHKHLDKEVSCHACQGLAGVRKFERSLTYECFYLPLGLDDKDAPRSGKGGWNVRHTCYDTITSQLRANGWNKV